MDGMEFEDRRQSSVWGIAAVAVGVFVMIIVVAGLFGSAEMASVSVAKG